MTAMDGSGLPQVNGQRVKCLLFHINKRSSYSANITEIIFRNEEQSKSMI